MVEERIVDRWLARGQRFFRAVTLNTTIRGALAARGLTNAELAHGWGLFAAVMGLEQKTVPPPAPVEAALALAEVDAWDAPNFSAAQAVLEHRTPKANSYLFAELTPDEGPKAVVAVERFLERWEALRKGKAEGVSKREASEAVELLDVRRIVTLETAAHLHDLIGKAKHGAALPEGLDSDELPDNSTDEVAFQAYRAWINEWREIARSTFTRRDYLISLGLAARRGSNRRSQQDDDDDEDDDEEEPRAAS